MVPPSRLDSSLPDTDPVLLYTPGQKRELEYYPYSEWLYEELGHDYTNGQDWNPDDRVLDCAGRSHRIVFDAEGPFYQLQFTGEVWDTERILSFVSGHPKRMGRHVGALDERLAAAKNHERIKMIMEYVRDTESRGSRFKGISLLLLALTFFALLVYSVGSFLTWLLL